MVSPLKGLTRAQITARAAARKAQLAAKKGARKKRTTAAPKAAHVRVSQATVNRVLKLGKAKALTAAHAANASAELKEAVARIYPGAGATKGTHVATKKKPVLKKAPAKTAKLTLKQRQSERNQ